MTDRERVIKGLRCHVYGHPHTRCHKCPYWGTGPHGASECNDLVADAFALINALMKAQEPRLMTLEEALEAEYVYLEVRLHSSLQCECCILIKDEDGDIVPLKKGFWGSLESDDYGKEWRCWTSRPTDEQRRATPWQ